jgi:hypothetical protein
MSQQETFNKWTWKNKAIVRRFTFWYIFLRINRSNSTEEVRREKKMREPDIMRADPEVCLGQPTIEER